MKIKQVIFLFLIFILFSCSKEGQLMTGDVIGKVKIYNQFDNQIHDFQNMVIKLYNDEIDTLITTPNEDGEYKFANLQTNTYFIKAQKEGFLNSPYKFSHLGGTSPSFVEVNLTGIVTYAPTIDSIYYNQDTMSISYLRLSMKGQLVDTVPLFDNLYLFYGYDKNVSKDNYVGSSDLWNLSWYEPGFDYSFDITTRIWTEYIKDKKEVYFILCIYNDAINFHYSYNYYGLFDLLGPPSNVYKLVVL